MNIVIELRDRYLPDVNFISELGEDEDAYVSDFSYRPTDAGMSFSSALRFILDKVRYQGRPKPLVYYVKDGIVRIITKEDYNKIMRLDIIEVHDLLFGISDFPPEEEFVMGVERRQPLTTREEQERPTTEDLQKELTDQIKRATGGDKAWGEGTSIVIQNGVLIATNRPDVLRKVRRFIENYRKLANVMVNVEARFITITEHLLEDIGIDFRDVSGQRIFPVPFTPYPGAQTTTLPHINIGKEAPEFTSSTAGIVGTFGEKIVRNLGARIEHLLANEQIIRGYMRKYFSRIGGSFLQFTLLDDVSVEAIMRAVRKSERSNLLVDIKLSLLNGQLGSFVIGGSMPYIRRYTFVTGGFQVVPQPEFDEIPYGTVLSVRPVVSADRKYVTMELRPTVTDIGRPEQFPTPTGDIEQPSLNVHRIRTTAVVPDRATLFIGGFTDITEIKTESSIPFLRNLPIFGALGREKITATSRRRIIVLIKPTIIIPAEEEKKLR
jgi:type II secretory pathway component GspD/PulD (secretin)